MRRAERGPGHADGAHLVQVREQSDEQRAPSWRRGAVEPNGASEPPEADDAEDALGGGGAGGVAVSQG